MDLIYQTYHQYPQHAALAGVLIVAALLSFASRQIGQLTISDLTVGPKELLKGAMICSALYALLITAVVALFVTAAASVTVGLPVAAVAGMVAFVNALAPAFAMQQNGSAEVGRRKDLGKTMTARCQKLFQRVDRRGKGLLNEDDLNAAIARADLTAADKEALIYVRDHAENIGTVVERSVTRHHVVPGAIASGFAIVVPQTVKHYAVSEDDLNAYPSRLEQLYKLWD